MNTRRICSYTLKILTILSALGGVLVALFNATHDGYSHWSKRLLYFTTQSNLWLAFTFLAVLLAPFFRVSKRTFRRLYALKFVFTVCISVTFLVFCLLLAPFADESYHVWEFSSFLTHIFAPAFAIADFFVDGHTYFLERKHVAFCLLPPLFYLLTTAIFSGFSVDFGRGVAYPYYFMNFRSPAGFFGFSPQAPYFIGSFYWYLLLAAMLYFIALFYFRLRTRLERP